MMEEVKGTLRHGDGGVVEGIGKGTAIKTKDRKRKTQMGKTEILGVCGLLPGG